MACWELHGPQELFVCPKVVADVNRVLEAKGNVWFDFEDSPSAPREDNMVRVIPRWKKVDDCQNYHSALNDANDGNTPLSIWTDCGRTSAAVVGIPSVVLLPQETIRCIEASRLNQAQALASSVLFHHKAKLEEATRQALRQKQKQQRSFKQISAPKHANFLSGIKGFDQNQLQPQITTVRNLPQVESATTQPIGTQELLDIWKLYGDLFLADSDSIFFRDIQINQFIEPAVGDALVVMPATTAPVWLRTVPPPTLYSPNFHWAPVCFVSSAESGEQKYICLESFSTLHKGGSPEDISQLWEFREYKVNSPDSYHSKAHLSKGYGNVTISLLVPYTPSALPHVK